MSYGLSMEIRTETLEANAIGEGIFCEEKGVALANAVNPFPSREEGVS